VKALFLTTPTSDCDNHFHAWESVAGPTDRFIHKHMGPPMDKQILGYAAQGAYDIVIYIGAAEGKGVPTPDTFRKLRRNSKVINFCSDAIDPDWHKAIKQYRDEDCFDLHVAMDGAKNDHVDLVTVTPIDPRPFSSPPHPRVVKCGFSGSVGPWGAFHYSSHHAAYRAEVVHQLLLGGQLIKRARDPDGSYAEHIKFMETCGVLLNVSYCGTGYAQHVKGRVLEAGFAGCALLEPFNSPALDWLPARSMYLYEDPDHAVQLMYNTTEAEIAYKAKLLSKIIREKYHPALIYGSILESAGVDHSLTVTP